MTSAKEALIAYCSTLSAIVFLSLFAALVCVIAPVNSEVNLARIIGAGLAGLCGALYAPTMTLIPTMGATFVVESFVTVVVGGANVLLGTAPAAVFLAMIRMALNASYGQIIGQIA